MSRHRHRDILSWYSKSTQPVSQTSQTSQRLEHQYEDHNGCAVIHQTFSADQPLCGESLSALPGNLMIKRLLLACWGWSFIPVTRSLGDLLTMVINHLISGMILQVGVKHPTRITTDQPCRKLSLACNVPLSFSPTSPRVKNGRNVWNDSKFRRVLRMRQVNPG